MPSLCEIEREYLKAHAIHVVFDDLLRGLLRDKPHNPVQYAAARLLLHLLGAPLDTPGDADGLKCTARQFSQVFIDVVESADALRDFPGAQSLIGFLKSSRCKASGGPQGRTASRWSDGISESAPSEGAATQERTAFCAAGYRAPPFLEALRELPLENTHAITADINRHWEESDHGERPHRPLTMDHIIEKAVRFAEDCRRDPARQHVCELLDEDHICALYVYTLETEIYSKLTAIMTGASAESEKWRPVIHHIHAALARLPSYSLTPLYRITDRKVEGCTEGRLILWPHFASSTVNLRIVQDLATEGGSIFILKALEQGQGHRIDALSEFKEEGEVVFEPNTWFRVQRKLQEGPKRFLADHMGMTTWEVMQQVDVYELNEVAAEDAPMEDVVQRSQLGAASNDHVADAIPPRQHTHNLIKHILESSVEACKADIDNGADVNHVHNGTSPMALAASQDLKEVCAHIAHRQVESIRVAAGVFSCDWMTIITVSYCERLTSLTISEVNHVGEAGARGIARHCRQLVALHIGKQNQLGLAGVRILLQDCNRLQNVCIGGWHVQSCPQEVNISCQNVQSVTLEPHTSDADGVFLISTLYPRLTHLVLGAGNSVGEAELRTIGQHCTALTCLTIGDHSDIGEGGARAIGQHFAALTCLAIGRGNVIGERGARAIGVHCTGLTSLTIGHGNQIWDYGMRAIGQNCTALVSLTVGQGNRIGEGGARAIGDHCTSLTSLAIGDCNDIGEGGAVEIGRHCTGLTSLSIGSGNNIGELGARAIGENCTALTSLTIGAGNMIGEAGARAISEHCTGLTSLTSRGQTGIRRRFRAHGLEQLVSTAPS